MNLLHLDATQWFLSIFCALLIGFSKSGFLGAAASVVPIMAGIFGGKASSGIILPMIIIGDFFAVGQYKRNAELSYIFKKFSLYPYCWISLELLCSRTF